MNPTAIVILFLGIVISLGVLGYAVFLMLREGDDDAPDARTDETTAHAPTTTTTDGELAPGVLAEIMAEDAALSDKAAATAQPPHAQTTAARPDTPALTTPPAAPQLREVTRLFRDDAGRLVVELGGQRYFTGGALRDDMRRTSLRLVVEDLNRFLEQSGPTPYDAPPFLPPTGSSGSTGTLPDLPQTGTLSEPPPRDDSADVIKLDTREALNRPLDQPSWSIGEQIRKLREGRSSPRIEVKTMLEEVDELLQARIADTPLDARGFAIEGNLDGTLRITLDGQVFTTIDAIPDARAQATLRACIDDWEQRP